jgi:hypothetical protein
MKRTKHIRKQDSDRPQKFIKIDPRTTILVDASIPDNEARKNYFRKMQMNKPANRFSGLDELFKKEM